MRVAAIPLRPRPTVVSAGVHRLTGGLKVNELS